MPTDPAGFLIPFTAAEVVAMEIETFGVRNFSHPIETRRMDENTMTRVFFVKWEERFNFIEHVIGTEQTWLDAGTTKLSRLLPDDSVGRHPDRLQIVATRIENMRGHGRGINDLNGMPAYEKAEVTVFYEHAPYLLFDDANVTNERQRYVTLGDTTEADAEAFTMVGAAFKFARAGGAAPHGVIVPTNISFVRPIERFTLWWEMLPFDLASADGALYKRLYAGQNAGGGASDGIPFIGTVNSVRFVCVSAGQAYDAGQLLLEGVTRQKLKSPLAASGFDGWRYRVGFKFAFTPRGWLNLFYFDPLVAANSGYYQVTNNNTFFLDPAVAADNIFIYNLRDHNELFNPNY